MGDEERNLEVPKNFYEALGIFDPVGLTGADILKAYRARMKQVHTDHENTSENHERSVAANLAFETLGSSEKRKEYDRAHRAELEEMHRKAEAGKRREVAKESEPRVETPTVEVVSQTEPGEDSEARLRRSMERHKARAKEEGERLAKVLYQPDDLADMGLEILNLAVETEYIRSMVSRRQARQNLLREIDDPSMDVRWLRSEILDYTNNMGGDYYEYEGKLNGWWSDIRVGRRVVKSQKVDFLPGGNKAEVAAGVEGFWEGWKMVQEAGSVDRGKYWYIPLTAEEQIQSERERAEDLRRHGEGKGVIYYEALHAAAEQVKTEKILQVIMEAWKYADGPIKKLLMSDKERKKMLWGVVGSTSGNGWISGARYSSDADIRNYLDKKLNMTVEQIEEWFDDARSHIGVVHEAALYEKRRDQPYDRRIPVNIKSDAGGLLNTEVQSFSGAFERGWEEAAKEYNGSVK